MIIAGLLLFALGSFIAAAATDLTMTIIGRAIQGAGAISAAVTAMIADSTRDEHRTKAMAMVGASIGLTFALSLVAAPPLYAAIGMAGLFALTGVLALAAIAVVAWVVPPAPMHAGTLSDPAARLPWPTVVFDPQLLRLNFGIFALHTVQMAMFVVVPVMLVERGLPLPHHWWVYLPVVLASFALMLPPIIAAERRGACGSCSCRRWRCWWWCRPGWPPMRRRSPGWWRGCCCFSSVSTSSRRRCRR